MTDRVGLTAIAAALAFMATTAAAQTIVIDGSGVRSEGSGPAVTGDIYSALPRSGAPARTTLPYNTSRGPVLAGQDTSLPPRQHSASNRIVLTPPGQRAAPAGRAAPAPSAETPRPVARAEPVRPAPAPTPAPAPAPKPAASPAPRAPAATEQPTTPVTRPVARAEVTPAPSATSTPSPAPSPAPAPAPAAAPEPKPVEQPRVAAVTPPVAAPDLTRIDFNGADTEVSAAGRAQLEQIAAGAKDDRSLRIQVKAYADSDTETDVWKRRVSLRRAQNVRRILLDNGIESFRILVRALGAPGPGDSAPGNRVDIELGRR